eukprot:gene7584-9325_t
MTGSWMFFALGAMMAKTIPIIEGSWRYVGGASIVFHGIKTYVFGKLVRTIEYPDGEMVSIVIRTNNLYRLKNEIMKHQPAMFPGVNEDPSDVKHISKWSPPHFTEPCLKNRDLKMLPDGGVIFWSRDNPIPKRGVTLDIKDKDYIKVDQAINFVHRLGKGHGVDETSKITEAQENALIDLLLEKDEAILALHRNFHPYPLLFKYHSLRYLQKKNLPNDLQINWKLQNIIQPQQQRQPPPPQQQSEPPKSQSQNQQKLTNQTTTPHQTSSSSIQFNRPILPGSISEECESLFIDSSSFNSPLVKSTIPPNVKHLELPSQFNQPLNSDSLPQNLENLIFGYSFNQPIEPNTIPQSVKYIKFSRNFNQSLDFLSEGIKKLELGVGFTTKITNNRTFPNSLEWLNLGGYNHLLEPGMFPNNLKSLFLMSFNQPLTNKYQIFPSSLTNLSLGFSFEQEFDLNLLPVGLKKLSFIYSNGTKGSLPPNIESLSISIIKDLAHSIPVGFIPNSVKSLKIENFSNVPIPPGDVSIIPNSVVKFSYYTLNHHPLPNRLIPWSVTEFIYRDNCFLSESFGLFVNQFKKLWVKGPYINSHSILKPNHIPNGVEYLIFGSGDGEILSNEGAIPETVTTMELVDENNMSLIKYPPKLQKLIIRDYYSLSTPIPIHVFPLTLKEPYWFWVGYIGYKNIKRW